MKNKVNIAIVEDNKSYASTLYDIINHEEDMQCLKAYENASLALEDIDFLSIVDVLLIDIQLPEINGIELLIKLKEFEHNTIYIMCTSYDDDDKLFKSLKSGAQGYVLKSDTPFQIIDSIRSAVGGNAPMSPAIARKVVDYFYRETTQRTKLSSLTPKENDILNLLSKGHLYKEIADSKHISIDTVKKHCGSIYRKLHVCNRTEALNIYFNH